MLCVDTWKRRPTPMHLGAYKFMIALGRIRPVHVVYHKKTGATVIEYESAEPHETIRRSMKDLVKEWSD